MSQLLWPGWLRYVQWTQVHIAPPDCPLAWLLPIAPPNAGKEADGSGENKINIYT